MKKATASRTKSSPRRLSHRKSGQILVNAKMLNETRSELKSDITTLRLETRAGFKTVDVRFKQVDVRFDHLAAEISEIKAITHRTLALIEEQNARNIFVLDGYTSLDGRLKNLEGL